MAVVRLVSTVVAVVADSVATLGAVKSTPAPARPAGVVSERVVPVRASVFVAPVGPVMISLLAFAPAPWLATSPAPLKLACAFNWVTAAASVVPAASVAVTAAPPATLTLKEPEMVLVAALRAKVAEAPTEAVGAVGVGFVIAAVVAVADG